MKTFKTLILISSLAGTAAFAQSAQLVNCPEGTILRNNEGLAIYCVKPSDGRLDTTPYVALHKNGKIQAQGEFVNGNREGLWEYFDEEGRLTGTTNFKNDQFDGKRAFFDKDGNLLEEQNWKAGNREGEWVKVEKGERKVRKFKADRLVTN